MTTILEYLKELKGRTFMEADSGRTYKIMGIDTNWHATQLVVRYGKSGKGKLANKNIRLSFNDSELEKQ